MFVKLPPRHFLHQVNGKNVEELSQKEIINIFRNISGTVSMEFFRFVRFYQNILSEILKPFVSIFLDDEEIQILEHQIKMYSNKKIHR